MQNVSRFLLFTGCICLLSGCGGAEEKAAELQWYGATELIPSQPALIVPSINSYDDFDRFISGEETTALLAHLPDKDISVYGYKESKVEGTFHLQGIAVQRGSVVQILDTEWGVYGEIPQVACADYDNDGIEEIALIVRSAHGTGLSFNELFILEPVAGQGFHANVYTDWATWLNDNSTYKAADGTLSVFIQEIPVITDINLALLEESWEEKLSNVCFGMFGEFYISGKDIYLEATPSASVGNWVTPQEINDTVLTLKVLYGKDETFSLEFLSATENRP